MLWYGGLVAVSLSVFAILVLLLATKVIYDNVDNAIKAEARVATRNIEQELSPSAPYWPRSLSLTTIDIYKEPGIAVEVLDLQQNARYRSSGDIPRIPLNQDALQAVQLNEQTQEYIQAVDSERVKVGVVAIHAPGGPIIGTLLVAKSLKETDENIFWLQIVFILSGVVVLTLAIIGGWVITSHILRPLTALVKTARTIASTAHGTHIGNLNQRVQRPHGDDEMAQVVDTFNEMLASLERSTLAQRRFIADASHELRAPLTTIQGNLAFLQRYLDDVPADERRTMLDDAYGETLRLARLVDELLLLARADANPETRNVSELEQESVPEKVEHIVELDHTLLQLVRQLRGRLNLDDAKLKLHVGHIEPVRVRGDEESLRRIILILLDNALKYTTNDEENTVGRITISLERCNEEEAVLQVQDTGIGIEAEDLPYIFDRFYRADRARSRQGTGLGLSIAQTLVEHLEGRITAQSEVGVGSTFRVWLPLA